MPKSSSEESLLLTVPQAAKLLQLSENSVYNLIAQGLLPHARYGKLIRIPRWGLLQSVAEASGAPLPNDLLASFGEQSVHVAQPQSEED